MSSDGDYLYLFAEEELGGVVQLHWTMLGGAGIGSLHVHARNRYHDHFAEWSDEYPCERELQPENDERINCFTVPIRVRENGDRLSVRFGTEADGAEATELDESAQIGPAVVGRATMAGELLTMTVLGSGLGTAKLTLHRGSAQDWTRMVDDYRTAVHAAATHRARGAC